MRTIASSLFLVVAAGLAPQVAAQCFNLDGSAVSDPGVAPCLNINNGVRGSNRGSSTSATAATMCCNLDRQAGGNTAASAANAGPDICLANGLCQATAVNAQGQNQLQFSRNACTRADWVGCLKSVCPSVTGNAAPMTPCGTTANLTTQWCCGASNSACCAAWPNHPDAAAVPLSFAALNGGSGNNAFKNGPGPVSLSQGGPGAATTFLTAATSLAGPTTLSSSARNRGTALPITTDGGAPGAGAGTGATGAGTGAATATAAADNSDNGESANVVNGTGGLSTQEVAGIVAGIVVVVVVLVSISCFTAENLYKKRQQRYRQRQRDTMKLPVGTKSRPLM
ncbi:hypothetical protein SPI_09387 [Niveomyces insectorum RCEF 264]|uniref:Uncharacterized protein n=1 Tax=Niveomyces insectorum RCEF 264 TaxID=1081102 RepID=A0A167LSU1_9HYPO|nr:hypothetical protein SPI_09387 [Niveomyces insectorum RCEF 264]